MRLHVLFHDSCFDGAASAAVFTRFYRERVRPDVQVTYQGLSHKAGGEPIDAAVFQGDENAIVDFRYSQDERLTWWFDHHQSAFQQAGDEAHFRADKSGRKFHDPTRKSCTRYIADVCRDRFGFDPSHLAELLHWAEIIDGALFESPQMAVELAEPALRLMTVIEANRDPSFSEQIITEMTHKPLSEIVARADVQQRLAPLLERHQRSIDVVRKKARYEAGVVFFDVADEGYDSLNKFIAYYLYPESRYTVWVGKSDKRAKVSIGSNPWRPESRTHTAEGTLSFQDSASLRVVVERSFDRLPAAFALGPITFAEGGYDWTRWSARYSSNQSRRISGSATLERGGYYGGSRDTARLSLNFLLRDTLLVEPNYTRNVVSAPGQPRYVTNTLNTRVSYSFSPDLFVKGFFQYNDARRLASLNLLLWYVYRPGSDLYIVYNHGWDTDLPGPRRVETRSRSFTVKLTYWLSR